MDVYTFIVLATARVHSMNLPTRGFRVRLRGVITKAGHGLCGKSTGSALRPYRGACSLITDLANAVM